MPGYSLRGVGDSGGRFFCIIGGKVRGCGVGGVALYCWIGGLYTQEREWGGRNGGEGMLWFSFSGWCVRTTFLVLWGWDGFLGFGGMMCCDGFVDVYVFV